MKRIIALSLSAALLLGLLCACTGGTDPQTTVIPSDSAGAGASVLPENSPSPEPSGEPGTEPSEEVPDEPSEEPGAEPSDVPASQAPASQAPASQAPASQAPASPDPSPVPSINIPDIFGPGNTDPTPSSGQPAGGDVYEPTGRTGSDVDLAAFLGTVFNNYAFPGMMELTTDWIVSTYPGLASIPAVQRVVYVVSASSDAAEIVLVQVTNSSDVSTVESILQTRIASQVNGGAYYLPAIEQWELNSRIKSNGDYIMLVVHSSCDAIVADFNALF